MSDPTMPKTMPPYVEQELKSVLGGRDRPNPVDLYNCIRDALIRLAKQQQQQ